MKRRKIPASAQVARWTAIAAGITAFGSAFTTIWEKEPWWMESSATITHATPAAPAQVSDIGSVEPVVFSVPNVQDVNQVEASAGMEIKPLMLESAAPVMRGKRTWSIWKWLTIAAGSIAATSFVCDWLIRRRHHRA